MPWASSLTNAWPGPPPFAGPALEVALAHRDCPLPPLPAELPPEVVDFVMQLTAKDPRWRPGRADEVAWRASQLRDDLTAGGPPAPAPPPAALPRTPTLAVIPVAPSAVVAGLTPASRRLRPRRRAALVSA